LEGEAAFAVVDQHHGLEGRGLELEGALETGLFVDLVE
jgi:hypothetical protein